MKIQPPATGRVFYVNAGATATWNAYFTPFALTKAGN
jgi:hypothetical protein